MKPDGDRKIQDLKKTKNISKKEEEWQPIVTFLKQLATIKGPVTFTLDARRRYNQWYHSFDIEEFHTKTGYEGRLGTHILKLSMILSAAKMKFDQRTIGQEELEEAIELCTSLLIVYKRMTYGTGIAETANYTILVTNLLLDAKNHHLSRMQILYKLHGNITGQKLDEVAKDLVDAGFVIEKSINGSAGYQLTEKFMGEFREKQSRNNNNQSRGHGASD